MRIILTFLLVEALLLCHGQSREPAPDGIKSIISHHYLSDGTLEYSISSDYSSKGWIEKMQYRSDYGHWNSTTYFENDEHGYHLFKYSIDTLGQVTDSARYQYDDYHQVRIQNRYYPQRGDRHTEEYEIIRDDAGNMIERKERYNGEPSWTYSYAYDEQGNLMHLNTVFEHEQRDEYAYTYDTDGRKTNFTLYDWNEGYRKKNTAYDYSYSEEGLLLQEDCSSWHYGLNRYVQSTTEYTYLYGLLDEASRYKEGVLANRIVYEYVEW